MHLCSTYRVVPDPHSPTHPLPGSTWPPGGLLIILKDPAHMPALGSSPESPAEPVAPSALSSASVSGLSACAGLLPPHPSPPEGRTSQGTDTVLLFRLSLACPHCPTPAPRQVCRPRLGGHMVKAAERKGCKVGLGPGRGAGMFMFCSNVPHFQERMATLVTLTTPSYLLFFLQFYCFLPRHLSPRQEGKKSWPVWSVSNENMGKSGRTVAFLVFLSC